VECRILSRKLDIISRVEIEKALSALTTVSMEWCRDQELNLYDTYLYALLQTDRMVFEQEGQRMIGTISDLFAGSPGGTAPAEVAGKIGSPFSSSCHDGWRFLPVGRVRCSQRQLLCRNTDEKGIARIWFVEFTGTQRLSCAVFFQALRGYTAESKAIEKMIRSGSGTVPMKKLNSVLMEALGVQLPMKRVSTPAPDNSANAILQDRLTQYVTLARRYERGVIGDLDPECLHQYRVQLRKARSLIGIFKPLFTDYSRGLKDLLGDLMKKTNRLRDLDVLLAARSIYLGMVPEVHQAGVQGLFQRFLLERTAEAQQVSIWFGEEAYEQLIVRAIQLLELHSPVWSQFGAATNTGTLARYRLIKIYYRIVDATRLLHAESPREDLHAQRMLHKRLRYLLEFFLDLKRDTDVRRLLSIMKGSQKQLGNYNDAAIQLSWLQAWGKQHENELQVSEKAALTALELAFQSQVGQMRAATLLRTGECVAEETRELVSRIGGQTKVEKMTEIGT